MNSGTSDSRISQILNIMELRKNARLESLAEKLNVGTKTIRNDIKELNQLLNGSALVESTTGRYMLFILDETAFHTKKQEIYCQNDYLNSPAKRYGYIMKRLMHEVDAILIDDLADEICVGRTTINGDLKKLRDMLGSYQVQIIGKTNTGIRLEGDEMQLRLFILEHMYNNVFEYFILDDDLENMVNNYCHQFGFDHITTQYFLRSYTLMIDRVLNDHPLEKLQEKYLDLKQTMAYIFAEKVVEETKHIFQIEIPAEEIIFLSLPIAGMRTPMNKDNMQMMEVSEEVAELVIKILNRIAYDMNFHIAPTDLLDEFVYHINFMLNRLKYHFYIKNFALTDIQEKFPLAYKMAELAQSVIEEQTNLIVLDDELGFMASYFSLFLEEQQYRSKKSFRVGIVCAHGAISGKLIEIQLKKMLLDQTEFELLTEDEASGRNDFDLIISTARKFETQSVPVIYLEEVFDEVEVLRKIEQLRYTKHLNVSLKTGLNSLIAAILEPEHFFVLNRNLTYMENLLYMTDSLIEEGVLEPDFREKLLMREEKSTTVFDENIAFPHLQHDGSNILLSLGVIERPETESGIRIILLLALPEEPEFNDDVLVHIYNELLVISSHDMLIQEFSKLKSENEFILSMIKHNEMFE
ncbi:MAG: PRD domain-containing protein [Lachnospiraceae bacterium]|nr:PRD domain-containing protein [Lachnospiraceae bacterium]